MDANSPVKKPKSKRSSRTPVLAAGLLAASAGAAYYFDYLPPLPIELPFELPFEIPWAESVITTKTKPAPVVAKPRLPASGVPPAGAKPASPGQQTRVEPAPGLAAPAAAKAGEQAKQDLKVQKSGIEKDKVAKPSGPAAKKSEAKATTAKTTKVAGKSEPAASKPKPRKRKVARKAKPAPQPLQVERVEDSLPPQPVTRQVDAEPRDELLAPEPPAAKYAHTPAKLQPLPAPVEVESVPVEAVEPPLEPRVITPKYNDLMTPVMRGDQKAVKQLLDLGWWVDKPTDSGITPLTAAVMNRDIQMARLLLDHGATLEVEALKIAKRNKDSAMVSLLEQRRAR